MRGVSINFTKYTGVTVDSRKHLGSKQINWRYIATLMIHRAQWFYYRKQSLSSKSSHYLVGDNKINNTDNNNSENTNMIQKYNTQGCGMFGRISERIKQEGWLQYLDRACKGGHQGPDATGRERRQKSRVSSWEANTWNQGVDVGLAVQRHLETSSESHVSPGL